jgi:hypothetical protein
MDEANDNQPAASTTQEVVAPAVQPAANDNSPPPELQATGTDATSSP